MKKLTGKSIEIGRWIKKNKKNYRTDSKQTQVLEPTDKNVKVAITNIFKDLKESIVILTK